MPDVSLDDVLAARETIAGRLHRTPTFTSATLSERSARACTSRPSSSSAPARSSRAACSNKLAALTAEERARGVVTWSAGNHAQAVAYGGRGGGDRAAASSCGGGANPLKVEATRGYGAEVDLEAADPAGAYERLLEWSRRPAARFVHPFDDPSYRRPGHASGSRSSRTFPTSTSSSSRSAAAASIAGIATAVRACGRGRVVGVEPELSPALPEGLAAGEVVRVEPRSIADGLGAPFAGDDRSPSARERVDEVVLVSEAEIEDGVSFPLPPGQARLRARRRGGDGRAAGRQGPVGAGTRRSPSSRGATRRPKPPLLSWLGDEGRHPSRLRARHRTLRVRKRVPDPLDEARAARRDLLGLPPFYTGKQKLVDTGGRVERFQRKLERAAAHRG